MKMVGKGRSRINPKFCEACFRFGEKNPGGAHVDLGMVFADIRGSTGLAEQLGDRDFRSLINRFFQASAGALVDAGAVVDRLAGDEAIGFFVPGLAGPQFARRTLESATDLLLATGHGDDPWVPVGVGAHFGNAFVGMVGSPDGVLDFTALGDDVNAGSRIASAAGPGELLASAELCRRAEVPMQNFERREIDLKGKQEPMPVVVLPLEWQAVAAAAG